MDLGLERAGMQCRWQVEIDPYCTKVLERHWPHVKRYGDIRAVTGHEVERVDMLAGGFPCVDISAAGRQAGITAPRSGLWFEYARLIRVLRPRVVLIENVARLLVDGFDRVLGELSACGYDAEWQVLSACAFGAPHPRRRVFIVAYPSESGLEGIYNSGRRVNLQSSTRDLRRHWSSEPNVDRVANGLSKWVGGKAPLVGLGNAVVPQVAEWIGRRILERVEGLS
jgi:DNA (cytosine-5)-methyltransferase 1